jgi:hypothetical protein
MFSVFYKLLIRTLHGAEHYRKPHQTGSLTPCVNMVLKL